MFVNYPVLFVGQVDGHGWSPMIMAAHSGHTEVWLILLEVRGGSSSKSDDGALPEMVVIGFWIFGSFLRWDVCSILYFASL